MRAEEKLAVCIIIALLVGAGAAYLAIQKPWRSGISEKTTGVVTLANGAKKNFDLDSRTRVGPEFGDKTLRSAELNEIVHALGVDRAYARISTWIIDRDEDKVILPPKETPIRLPICQDTPIRVPLPIGKLRELPDGRYDLEMQIVAYLYTGSKKAVVQAKKMGAGDSDREARKTGSAEKAGEAGEARKADP